MQTLEGHQLVFPSGCALQVKRVVMATLHGLTEMRRQLLAPTAAGLPRLAEQAGALSAALEGWVTRFMGRTDQVGVALRGKMVFSWVFTSTLASSAIHHQSTASSPGRHPSLAVLPGRPSG